MTIKREYFECMCGSVDHTVALCWIPGSGEERYYDDEVYFEMQLFREANWFKRVWNAMKYVFGRDYRSHWGECVLTKEEAIRMRTLLTDFIESTQTEE